MREINCLESLFKAQFSTVDESIIAAAAEKLLESQVYLDLCDEMEQIVEELGRKPEEGNYVSWWDFGEDLAICGTVVVDLGNYGKTDKFVVETLNENKLLTLDVGEINDVWSTWEEMENAIGRGGR